MKKNKIIHLNVKTHYSYGKSIINFGINPIPDNIHQTIEENGIKAIGIADYMSLSGAIDLYLSAKEFNIKPIIGLDLDFNFKKISNPITLIAKNTNGYKNLSTLLTILESNKNKILDMNLLSNYNKDLLLIFGNYESPKKDESINIEMIKALMEIFDKKDFYINIEDHNIDSEKNISKFMISISQKFDLKPVATNNPRFYGKDDIKAYYVYRKLIDNTDINYEKFKGLYSEFYLKSYEEMEKTFSSIPSSLKNIYEIEEKCNVKIFDKHNVKDNDKKSYDILKKEAYKKLSEMELNKKEGYKERLEIELKTIKEYKKANYYLILKDLYSKVNFQSFAGLFLFYIFEISKIDPLKFSIVPMKTFFESKGLEHILYSNDLEKIKKYLINMGALIIRPKYITISLPNLMYHVSNILYSSPDYMDKLNDIEKLNIILEISEKLKGINFYKNKIPVDIFIFLSPNDKSLLPKYENLYIDIDKENISKIDIFKIRLSENKSLNLIDLITKKIKKKNKNFDINKIPLDDKKVFDLINTKWAKEILPEIKTIKLLNPQNIEELAFAKAIFHPYYINDNRIETISKLVREYKFLSNFKETSSILKSSSGLLIYTDQAIKIIQEMTGLNIKDSYKLLYDGNEKIIPFILEKRKNLTYKYINIEYALLDYKIHYLKLYYQKEYNEIIQKGGENGRK
jgi:DNA polymerase-3 subunit alpha